MKYLMAWGVLAGAMALALMAWNNVENMRFARHEPGWTRRATWWLDRLMMVGAVMGLLGLAALVASMPPGAATGYESRVAPQGVDGVTAPGAEGLEGAKGVRP